MSRRVQCLSAIIFLWMCLCAAWPSSAAEPAYKTKNAIIAVMDGVRWMDTFGDPKHENIPHLYNDLRPLGTLFTNYYDRGITVTRQGHSTIISGTWQMVQNGGARLTRPTLFEYFRDEKGIPPAKAWSIFGKARYSFEPYSSHPAYGEKFAASHIDGSGKDNPINEATAAGDVGVLNKVVEVMKKDQPRVMFVNFGYTDHAGHIAKDISEYQAAIKNCDEQMWKLWNAVQADPSYKDKTTVFFTNDHGRHTNDFHGHGDHCAECEHIMLLVLGPDVKAGQVVETEALQIDIAPTAAELLGFQTPLATGRVLSDCLKQCAGVNKKEAVTDAARKAVDMEKLADRDLIKAAADWVLANVKPASVPGDAAGQLLARGMLRAYAESKEEKCLQFVQGWLDAHKGEGQPTVAAASVILDLPQPVRRQYMPLARKLGDRLAAGEQAAPAARDAELEAAVLLGRLGRMTKDAKYTEAGLKKVQAALAQAGPKPSDGCKAAHDLACLGQAATLYPDDKDLQKAFILALFQAVQGMKEEGVLWADPTASVVNLAAILSGQRAPVLQEFVKKQPGLPPVIEAMKPQEVAALFQGEKPNAPRRLLVNRITQRARQSLQFSRDMLRYGVDAEGKCADGSPLAQGGFLVAYQKLPWRYGGNTWPGAGKIDMGPKK